MFESLRVRANQGTQYITDLRKAVPDGFRGRPNIAARLRHVRVEKILGVALRPQPGPDLLGRQSGPCEPRLQLSHEFRLGAKHRFGLRRARPGLGESLLAGQDTDQGYAEGNKCGESQGSQGVGRQRNLPLTQSKSCPLAWKRRHQTSSPYRNPPPWQYVQ